MENRLKEIRKRRRVPQWELADASGYSQSTISKIEKGIQRMTFDHADQFAKVLKCQPGDLMDVTADLPEEEQAILRTFRQLKKRDKETVLNLAQSLTTL